MDNKRISWIDTSKALLLYLVLLGHIETHADFVYLTIFTFHMPAFFILSGYTHKEGQQASIFILKKIKSLIFPYFIFCFLGLILRLIYNDYYIFNHANLQTMLYQTFFTMQPDILFAGTGWFLFTLFWANIGGYAWIKYIGKFNKYIQYILVLLLCFFASNILFFNITIFNTERLPFKLDSAFMALFFWLVGYYLNKYNFMAKILKHIISSIVCVFIVYLLSFSLTFGSNMANCEYFNYPLYILAAISGSTIVYIISYYLDKIKNFQILREIGTLTLPLFMLQGIFLYYASNNLFIPIGRALSGSKSLILALCIIWLEYPLAKLYYKLFKRH